MDKQQVLTILTGLRNENAKKAAEIYGDPDEGRHGEAAQALHQAIKMIEDGPKAVEVLEELKNFDIHRAGYGHLLGGEPSPEWETTMTTATRIIERVRNIAKRGLRR